MDTQKIRKSPLWPTFLSAFVAPGVGQLYNKDFTKGFFLLFSSLGSILWFSKVLTERLSSLLPGTPDQWALNQAQLREMLTKLINENTDMFFTFQILMLVIWAFGVIDAYATARRNSNLPASPLPTDENKNPFD